MKKLLYILILFILSSIADAKYIRKVSEPNFFIPEQYKMHKQEKLPLIKKYVKNKDVKINIPEYKKKYDEYIYDIKDFSKTGFLPVNDNLLKDLDQMSTGDIFIVDDKYNYLKTSEYLNFNLLLENILKN